MAIRLAALDVDGTLLAPDNSITPATVEAIEQAVEAGIEIVVSTGRAFVELRYRLICARSLDDGAAL